MYAPFVPVPKIAPTTEPPAMYERDKRVPTVFDMHVNGILPNVSDGLHHSRGRRI